MSPRSTPVARRLPGPQLLPPLTLRGITFRNRLVVAPMCQYPATDGLLGDYHLGHLGRFALGGSGLVVVEATGVTPTAGTGTATSASGPTPAWPGGRRPRGVAGSGTPRRGPSHACPAFRNGDRPGTARGMTVTDPDVPDPLNDPRTLQADPGAVAQGEDLASTEDDPTATGEDELATSATEADEAGGGDATGA
jgi:hypothetical protein